MDLSQPLSRLGRHLDEWNQEHVKYSLTCITQGNDEWGRWKTLPVQRLQLCFPSQRRWRIDLVGWSKRELSGDPRAKPRRRHRATMQREKSGLRLRIAEMLEFSRIRIPEILGRTDSDSLRLAVEHETWTSAKDRRGEHQVLEDDTDTVAHTDSRKLSGVVWQQSNWSFTGAAMVANNVSSTCAMLSRMPVSARQRASACTSCTAAASCDSLCWHLGNDVPLGCFGQLRSPRLDAPLGGNHRSGSLAVRPNLLRYRDSPRAVF